MRRHLTRRFGVCSNALLVIMTTSGGVYGQERKPAPTVSSPSGASVGHLVSVLRGKAKALEGSSGMRLGFQAFTSAHKLAPESIHYSDYVVVPLVFEATRGAGFWNLHWSITDHPPTSDRIWQQWKNVMRPSP